MTIKVAIIGVGNCACALLQAVSWYGRNGPVADGLIMADVGGYVPGDIEFVAAFDVAEDKVSESLRTAAWVSPNDTFEFSPIRDYPVLVQRGPTLDGLGSKYYRTQVRESFEYPVDVAAALRTAGAQVVVNYLPVGSDEATAFYAAEAIKAGCAFVNCMPSFIASRSEWSERFAAAGLPVIGDDIKSQVGATIVHRQLATLMRERGVVLKRTLQLNVGGNGDFLNMLDRDRLTSKKISKTQAVTSVAGVELAPGDVHVGPSDYVPWLTDRKWAYIRLEGEGIGRAPMSIEVKLEVWDSPNSAGVVIDAVRCARVAIDRGLGGAQLAPSAYYMKSPPVQVDDDVARAKLEGWLR